MNSKTKELCQQNNILDEQISAENQSIFSDMICYLRGSNISDYDIEIVRQDLTEMVLSAQKRGEDISRVIGDDYKEFCDNVIANLPPKTVKQKIVETLDTICWGFSILLAINLVISKDTLVMIQNAINKKPVDLNVSVSVGSAISMVLIMILATWITNVIMKGAFNKNIKKKKIIAFFAGSIFMSMLVVIAWLGKGILFTINIFVACLLVVIMFAVHKVLEAISFG